jgi:hypothetical protein
MQRKKIHWSSKTAVEGAIYSVGWNEPKCTNFDVDEHYVNHMGHI